MKLFTFLIILSFIVINANEAFNSLISFLNYIEDRGFYDFFSEVKKLLGEDICISFCLDIFGSNLCDEVIRVYIPSSSSGKGDFPQFETTVSEIFNNYHDILVENVGEEKFNQLLQKYSN